MRNEEFTSTFEEIRPQLKSYILRITASVEDTEDIIQDTWIKANKNLKSFKGNSTIKTWLFAIASNLALDNKRAKKRWTENVTDICREIALSNPNYFPEIQKIQQTSQHAKFEIKEHISFCLTCISKSLPIEQQICILLKEVYSFKVKEIAEILQSTDAMVKYYLRTGKEKLVQIFESRCALINKKGTCHQCSELNGIFNPKQKFEEEKNKIAFAKHANDKDRQKLLDLRLKILKELDPFDSEGSDLQLHHLEHNTKVMENYKEKKE